MGKKLYIGNLPFSATDANLNEIFSECGTVHSAKIIMDKMSGRSKGFGFVEMSTDAEAQSAIQKFNGADFEGRNIKVNEAKEMEPRDNRGGGGFNRDRGGPRGGGRPGGFGGGRGGDRGDRGGNRY